MNWKKYKKLSKELKEEYNFRFRYKSFKFDTLDIILGLITIFSIFVMWIFIYYLFLTNPELDIDLGIMKLIFEHSVNLLKFGIYVIIGFIVWNFIAFLYKNICEWYWMRKNKIRIIPKWIEKMFRTRK